MGVSMLYSTLPQLICTKDKAPITCCMVDQKSTVFYVDKAKFIHTLVTPENQEVEATSNEGRATYNDSILVIGNNKQRSNTPEMAALSSQLENKTYRSRLYFANESNILTSIMKDGAGAWTFDDGLKKLNAQVIPGSPVTALMSVSAKTVKVYYYKPNQTNNRPWVAWWPGAGDWFTEST